MLKPNKIFVLCECKYILFLIIAHSCIAIAAPKETPLEVRAKTIFQKIKTQKNKDLKLKELDLYISELRMKSETTTLNPSQSEPAQNLLSALEQVGAVRDQEMNSKNCARTQQNIDFLFLSRKPEGTPLPFAGIFAKDLIKEIYGCL